MRFRTSGMSPRASRLCRCVGAFKTAMNLMGIFDSPTMPRPVKAMTGENVEAIRKVLQDNGLL